MFCFSKDLEIAASMSDGVEGGASLAWRLLATLEGGSLLLAASALLAYSARAKPRQRWAAPAGAKVAVTNITSDLGKSLKNRLEAHGCVVSAVTSEATSGVTSGADSERYDALVVVGSQSTADGLNGISGLVTEDVFTNIKLLESLSSRVNKGGCMAWACAGASSELGAFDVTASAFDAVLQASLTHVAEVSECVPVWVGRCKDADDASERLVEALFSPGTPHHHRFSIRNAALTVGEYLYRWLKIIT